MAKPIRLGLAALVAAAGVGTQTEPASSYVVTGGGCRFDPANDNDGLGIGFNSTNFNTLRRNATEDSAARWNGSMTPQFTLVDYGSSTRDVRVEFGFLGAGGGVATTTRWCGSNNYTQDPLITWNLSVSLGSDVFHYSEAAGHEFGHTYGLEHNNTEGCDGNTAGIMYWTTAKYGQCGWIGPTTDDAKGATDAHNG